MDCLPSMFISITLLFLLANVAASDDEGVKRSLLAFLEKLSPGKDLGLGWSTGIDPCTDGWRGVACNNRTRSVRSIVLEDLGLGGTIEASLLCKATSLKILSLANNSIRGPLPPDIQNCTELTHLYLSGNRLSGPLPSSLSTLKNLKRLDVSDNNFSGEMPDLSTISGLVSFHAQDNRLGGSIPQFDFSNIKQFNVSGNLFTGTIPEGGDRFELSSFSANSGLCGHPLPITCPPTSPPEGGKSKKKSSEKAILYSGYIILGLFFALFAVYKILKRRKEGAKDEEGVARKRTKKKSKKSETRSSPSSVSGDLKTVTTKSDYSAASSPESAMISTSLVVMANPVTEELRFEDLLKAPAELVARGKFGSLYKVLFDNKINLAVKRVRDSSVSASEFRRRMERIDRLSHPNVLPPVAFYCSKHEKLVVYEYQENGSLSRLIQASQENKKFDWGSRLNTAAGIAEGLACLHRELSSNAFGHGNLKSSNIIMDGNMDACISEYGLMDTSKQRSPEKKAASRAMGEGIQADVYGYGIILLELLTGKVVQSDGLDLAKWVHSVVSEEWTAEVFDRALVAGGASEERMVHLLQVALKCVESLPENRPTMSEVVKMIRTINEEDDGSSIYEAE